MPKPTDINFSYSLIKHLQKSPAHAVAAKQYPTPSTPDQLFALAIEAAIQEPERFNDEYFVYSPPLTDEEKAIQIACHHPDEFMPKHYMVHQPSKSYANVKASKPYKLQKEACEKIGVILLTEAEYEPIQKAAKKFKETGEIEISEKKNIKATKHFQDMKHRNPPGRLLLEDEAEQIENICVKFWTKERLQEIYDGGTPQLKLEVPFGNTKAKGFPDYYQPKFKLFNDLKVVTDASDDAVELLIFRNNWHVQQAGYRWMATELGIDITTSMLTFIELEYPHEINTVNLIEEQLEIGERIWFKYLDFWEDCVNSNHFPGYSDEIHSIKTPPWIARKHYEEQY